MSRNFELLQRLGLANTPLDPIEASERYGVGEIERCVLRSRPSPPEPELSRMAQRLFGGAPDRPSPTAVVFSSVERTRPSGIASRTAELLASQTNSSVCVVDAAFDDPSVHEHFGIPLEYGLADALVEPGPINGFAHRVDGLPLAVVTAGVIPAEAHPTMQAEALARRLRELRSQFHYVLLEGPPASDFSNAALLGRLVDGVVLVIEAHATRRDAAHRAKTDLQQGSVLVLGAVLNNRTFPIPESVYSRLF